MNFKSVRIEFVNRRFVALGSFSEIAFAPTRFRTNSAPRRLRSPRSAQTNQDLNSAADGALKNLRNWGNVSGAVY